MAHIATTWAEVHRRYPTQIEEVLKELRASRSKFKNAAPEDLVWCFSVAWRCDSPYLGSPTDGPSIYLWNLGRVEVYLKATAPTKRGLPWSGGVRIEVPDEVKADLAVRCQKQVQDRLEYEALTPEEKERQFHEALAYLRKVPGFIELRVDHEDK